MMPYILFYDLTRNMNICIFNYEAIGIQLLITLPLLLYGKISFEYYNLFVTKLYYSVTLVSSLTNNANSHLLSSVSWQI